MPSMSPFHTSILSALINNAIEGKYIPNVSLRPFDSPFGHCAANPGYDKGFESELDKNMSELLN